MPTMKEVAREAGVSVGTVSNVLNNVSTVSEENRKKVLEAVEKLKYSPNFIARSLKTGHSKSLGLVIPDITNPFYPEVARGVEDKSNQMGYSVFLCNNDRSLDKEKQYIKVLIEKNVDGIILVKPSVDREELSEIGDRCGLVLVDVNPENAPGFDVVNSDDYDGIKKAMEYLYEQGHRRIAFITGMLESESSRLRRQAYLDFLREKGLESEDGLVKKGNYDWHSGFECMKELIREGKPFTAVVSSNDLMAIGAMKAAIEQRIRIPEDISVVGFDDIDMSLLCSPRLTTVRQPKYELGAASVNVLVNRLLSRTAGKEQKGETITLKTELIVRESTGRAKDGSHFDGI